MRWLLALALFGCGESRDETRASTARLLQASVQKIQVHAIRLHFENQELEDRRIQHAIDRALDELGAAQTDADRAAAKAKVDRLRRSYYELEQNLEPKRIDVVVPPPPSTREHHEQRRSL